MIIIMIMKMIIMKMVIIINENISNMIMNKW